MKAIHVNSTAPFFARGGKNIEFEDFDLYTTALSALMWRKYNGEISLITDEIGEEYFHKAGLSPLWNNILPLLPTDLEGISPTMFWAGGKLLALRDIPSPIVMIDTDFIVWGKMDFSDKVIGAHFEQLYPDVYPNKEYFRTSDYIFPEFDWTALPVNTAFLYLPDEGFKQFYTSQAISFMKSAKKTGDSLCYMVLAEQRMLSMCGKLLGFEISTLLDMDKIFHPQDKFTHLWGAKQQFRDNPKIREDFCNRCEARLLKEFPEYKDVILKIRNIK